MTNDVDTDWERYYRATENRPPRPLLQRAVAWVSHPGIALDLGAGAGVDTRYLLEQGFTVTAVDADVDSARRLKAIPSDRLTVVRSRFDAFAFEPDRYDLVSAQLALPFNPPETFAGMFTRLRGGSLQPGSLPATSSGTATPGMSQARA